MRTLPVALDRASNEPLYRQLENQIRRAIRDGRLRVGTRLPGIRTLAEQLQIARITVATAYENLASEGYVVGRAGAGTRVSDDLPEEEMWVPPNIHTARRGVRSVTAPRNLPRGPTEHIRPQVDLRPGGLSLDLFPTKLWGRLLRSAWREFDEQGEVPSPLTDRFGDPVLRDAIASFVGAWRGVYCRAENVFILPTVTAVCSVAARAFLPESGVCALEDPGCPFFTRALGSRGALLAPVPVDQTGLDPSALPPTANLLLVGPAWQYPLGGTMTVERRREVLRWAAKTGAIVIEHDWAGAIRYRGAPLPSMQSEDMGNHVVHVGSFLETVAVGSVAYAIVPDRHIERFVSAMTSSDLPPSGLDQRTLARFITEGHLDRHLRRARLALQERQTYLISLLRHQLGCRVDVDGQEAGEHLIVHVTPEARIAVKDLVAHCSRLGLELSALREFALGSHADEAFVISYGSARECDLKAAVDLIAQAMNDAATADSERVGRLSA